MNIKNFFSVLSCDIHNNIIEPLSRWYYSHKKTHYECCVCGMLEAPYFDDLLKGSMKWDYGWHKIDGGKRWVCHHCVDHSYAPYSDYEGSFEYWYENFVMPHRTRVRKLIKTKDPKYYDNHYFYDDKESVERTIQKIREFCGTDEDEE